MSGSVPPNLPISWTEQSLRLRRFFAGQEQAESLVDVLLGVVDPGGRLPTTIPIRLADHPAYLHHRPDHDSAGNGNQAYGEGLFIGYRGYDARDIAPRFAVGHGLSYGSWDKFVVEPGASHAAQLEFPRSAFRRWDTATGGWIVDAGDYELVIAASATDIRQRLRVTLA